MTAWTVVRMERAPEGQVGLECLEGEYPMKVTLKDTDTGTIDVIQLCAPLGDTDPCTVLGLLTVGHTPNDWSAECI